MAQRKISPISLTAAHILQQVKKGDLSAAEGRALLQNLALKCGTVRDIRFVDIAHESIGDFEQKWRKIPGLASYPDAR
ncbi:MAG: hypothetical protein HN368_23380 [Spirochaetales bacterium]|jgi:hypothetical protein|nr:hypothetical protein [Spirochaetales bacterium]